MLIGAFRIAEFQIERCDRSIRNGLLGKGHRNLGRGESEMLYVSRSEYATSPTTVPVPPRRVSVRDIRGLRTKAARAELAADLISGKAALNPDPQTAAAVCGVSLSYVRAVVRIRKCRPDLAPRLRRQPVYAVAAAAGFGWTPQHQLITSWTAASDAQRVAFVRQVTTDRVWHALAAAFE